MRPAIEPGDWLLIDPTVDRWPRRGSVVLFHEPDGDTLAVKRVAAGPGQRVAFADGYLELADDEAWLLSDASPEETAAAGLRGPDRLTPLRPGPARAARRPDLVPLRAAAADRPDRGPGRVSEVGETLHDHSAARSLRGRSDDRAGRTAAADRDGAVRRLRTPDPLPRSRRGRQSERRIVRGGQFQQVVLPRMSSALAMGEGPQRAASAEQTTAAAATMTSVMPMSRGRSRKARLRMAPIAASAAPCRAAGRGRWRARSRRGLRRRE